MTGAADRDGGLRLPERGLRLPTVPTPLSTASAEYRGVPAIAGVATSAQGAADPDGGLRAPEIQSLMPPLSELVVVASSGYPATMGLTQGQWAGDGPVIALYDWNVGHCGSSWVSSYAGYGRYCCFNTGDR